MNNLKNIVDVTNDTFQAQVLERSHQIPVLVDYWADWCGPCQMQMPVLKKLVDEHAGNFVLAKINTDVQRDLARDHGIRSLPTMRLYKDGQVVEEILGAQTEATLRILLDRYIERASDRVRKEALAAYNRGDNAAALAMLGEALQSDPQNHRVTLDYAELCLKEGQLAEAEKHLTGLPRDIREEPEARRLLALLEFAKTAADTPSTAELESRVADSPGDLEAQYLLGARYVLDDRPEAALETFLGILQRDRKFRDDAGRTALLAVFELLGNEGDLVSDYRRKLFNAMH